MQEETTLDDQGLFQKEQTSESSQHSPILNKSGGVAWLMGGRVKEGKNEQVIVKARSTTKFVFQILIGICLYSIVLSTLMIFKKDASLNAHLLMAFISLCANGIFLSITLYIFYPLIAPHIFDFHLGFFYTKPLSFYIHIIAWDSIHIIPLSKISAIQIIQIENYKGRKNHAVNQTNIVLSDGERFALTIQTNTLLSQTKEDAQKLAEKLFVPVWDAGVVSL